MSGARAEAMLPGGIGSIALVARSDMQVLNEAPRHSWIAVVDTVLLFAYIALQEPGGATDFALHEWLGVAFIPLFILHIALSWRWVTMTWRRVRHVEEPNARINFLLNAALFVMMTVIIVSGLMISEYAAPAVGVPVPATRRWEQFHNATASLITPVIALHLALNWRWIVRAMRRYLLPRRRVVVRESDVTE